MWSSSRRHFVAANSVAQVAIKRQVLYSRWPWTCVIDSRGRCTCNHVANWFDVIKGFSMVEAPKVASVLVTARLRTCDELWDVESSRQTWKLSGDLLRCKVNVGVCQPRFSHLLGETNFEGAISSVLQRMGQLTATSAHLQCTVTWHDIAGARSFTLLLFTLLCFPVLFALPSPYECDSYSAIVSIAIYTIEQRYLKHQERKTYGNIHGVCSKKNLPTRISTAGRYGSVAQVVGGMCSELNGSCLDSVITGESIAA